MFGNHVEHAHMKKTTWSNQRWHDDILYTTRVCCKDLEIYKSKIIIIIVSKTFFCHWNLFYLDFGLCNTIWEKVTKREKSRRVCAILPRACKENIQSLLPPLRSANKRINAIYLRLSWTTLYTGVYTAINCLVWPRPILDSSSFSCACFKWLTIRSGRPAL